MDIINDIMTGGDIIINNKNNCLLSPSIKCDDNNVNYLSYSSKILPNNTEFYDYIQDYDNDHNVDPYNKYLIELKKKCNIEQNKINQCSKLDNIDNNNIKNIITEESYSLQNYIDNPELLRKFIDNEPDFLKIFLSEFKNLFEALIFLDEKNISHLMINPNNIIFNQQTKKMKFINFGTKETKQNVIDFLNQNTDYKYDFNIYYPFISFFVNYENYEIYKELTEEKNKDFINFLKHIFFDENYNKTHISNSRDLYKLKQQFIILKNDRNFIKYKKHIKSHYVKDKINFFNGILTYNKNNYIKNTFRKTFLKYIVNAVDIYGLSMSLLLFFKIFKNIYSIDPNVYDNLLNCFNNLAINIPSQKIERTCIPEKSFAYFNKKYNEILKYIQNKQQPNNNNNISQYKLKSRDIAIYKGNSDKNYIDYNGKLMRAFNTTNIFTHLNNLSSYNYSIIQKIIDEHTPSIHRLIILIDKEAYYKIKYNLYCSDNQEVNIYTRKCVSKCPKNYRRNFNDTNFKCTRKNLNNENKDDNINKNKNENEKNKNKNQNEKTKKCPSGYERNPFTKICTRKCPSGYIRNLKFNCIAEKDVL